MSTTSRSGRSRRSRRTGAGMELEDRLVPEPRQRRQVLAHDVVDIAPALGAGMRVVRTQRGRVGRCGLLVIPLAPADAVGRAHHRDRSVVEPGEHVLATAGGSPRSPASSRDLATAACRACEIVTSRPPARRRGLVIAGIVGCFGPETNERRTDLEGGRCTWPTSAATTSRSWDEAPRSTARSPRRARSRIHGRLTGAITVEGEVSVAAGSEVRADINAHTISLAGRVKGNLTAPGAVVLPAQSRVEGDVRAQNVTVHGAVTGDVRRRGGRADRRTGARRRRHHLPHPRDRRGRVLRGPVEHVGAALAAPPSEQGGPDRPVPLRATARASQPSGLCSTRSTYASAVARANPSATSASITSPRDAPRFRRSSTWSITWRSSRRPDLVVARARGHLPIVIRLPAVR